MKDLIREYEERVLRYEEQINQLRNKLIFYSEHKFEEEKRLIRVKLEASEMIVYKFREFINELKKCQNTEKKN